MSAKPWKEHLSALAFFVVATLLMTYPLSAHMARSVTDPYDPLFTTWTLRHDMKQLVHDPLRLFDGNIFWPHRYTLALSEHQLANALLLAPVYLVTGNPILMYNAGILLTFVLSGFAVYLLVRDLTGSWFAALVAGFLFAYSIFRFSHRSHLQILTTQWLPLSLLYLNRWCFGQPSRKNAWLFGLFFTLNALACYYHALFGGAVVGMFVLFAMLLRRRRFPWRRWDRPARVVLVVALVNVPFALPYYYWSQQPHTRRSAVDAGYYSAQPGDYLVPGRISGAYKELTESWRVRANAERWVFPGALLYVLGAIGLFVPVADATHRKQRWLWAWVAVGCFVLSIGPVLRLGGGYTLPMPYVVLHEWLPGFQALRAPARMALWTSLALACLAGIGTAAMGSFLVQRVSKRLAFVGGAVLVALAALELRPHQEVFRLTKIPVGREIPSLYRWLGGQDVNAVLFLPVGSWGHPPRFWAPMYMYYSTYHWKPMVNGYSGFFPEDYSQWSLAMSYIGSPGRTGLVGILELFPQAAAVEALRRLEVDMVIVLRDGGSAARPGMSPEDMQRIRKAAKGKAGIDYRGEIDGADVYRIHRKAD